MDLLRVEHICETYGGGEAAVHVLKVSDGVLTDLGAPGMKSYLSLIPISARVRRQNRMTLLCIIFAVFLVTGIFSMAELFIQSETANARETGGNWHINLENISEEKATSIAQRPDVAACSWFGIQNVINSIQTPLCGVEEPFRTDIMTYFPEGASLEKGEAQCQGAAGSGCGGYRDVD